MSWLKCGLVWARCLAFLLHESTHLGPRFNKFKIVLQIILFSLRYSSREKKDWASPFQFNSMWSLWSKYILSYYWSQSRCFELKLKCFNKEKCQNQTFTINVCFNVYYLFYFKHRKLHGLKSMLSMPFATVWNFFANLFKLNANIAKICELFWPVVFESCNLYQSFIFGFKQKIVRSVSWLHEHFLLLWQ